MRLNCLIRRSKSYDTGIYARYDTKCKAFSLSFSRCLLSDASALTSPLYHHSSFSLPLSSSRRSFFLLGLDRSSSALLLGGYQIVVCRTDCMLMCGHVSAAPLLILDRAKMIGYRRLSARYSADSARKMIYSVSFSRFLSLSRTRRIPWPNIPARC